MKMPTKNLVPTLLLLAVVSCASEAEHDPMEGRWRIVKILQDGQPVYQIGSAPMVIDLEFQDEGVGRRIMSQVATGERDTTAISFTKTDTEMVVSAPGEETVTYGYTLSENGTAVTFTSEHRVLRLQRVGT